MLMRSQQEKPVENKVIFESEEQFVNFWKDLTGCDCLPGTREKIKQKGYIRKSAISRSGESFSRKSYHEYIFAVGVQEKEKNNDAIWSFHASLKSAQAKVRQLEKASKKYYNGSWVVYIVPTEER
jgi:hypothetical protein